MKKFLDKYSDYIHGVYYMDLRQTLIKLGAFTENVQEI